VSSSTLNLARQDRPDSTRTSRSTRRFDGRRRAMAQRRLSWFRSWVSVRSIRPKVSARVRAFGYSSPAVGFGRPRSSLYLVDSPDEFKKRALGGQRGDDDASGARYRAEISANSSGSRRAMGDFGFEEAIGVGFSPSTRPSVSSGACSYFCGSSGRDSLKPLPWRSPGRPARQPSLVPIGFWRVVSSSWWEFRAPASRMNRVQNSITERNLKRSLSAAGLEGFVERHSGFRFSSQPLMARPVLFQTVSQACSTARQRSRSSRASRWPDPVMLKGLAKCGRSFARKDQGIPEELRFDRSHH
jgi:hypothetical protein